MFRTLLFFFPPLNTYEEENAVKTHHMEGKNFLTDSRMKNTIVDNKSNGIMIQEEAKLKSDFIQK